MSQEKESWCIVLSGGGAKGVYHIGVWKALRELGIEVNAFFGASIGAIIAAFLAQGSDEVLEDIGRSITIDNVLALPDELTEDGEVKLDRESLSSARELFRSIMDRKGLDTSPLRKTITSRLDETGIRKSGRDLGIVTVNLSDLEPRQVYLEDMEAGRLVDYLMASAAFPGFEQTVIDGKKYVDGGIYDNIPYKMARQRGYRRIIVSDISGAGRNRKPSIEGSVTAYIKNSIAMGGVLDFNRDFLDSFTRLGYLDAMRTFGRYTGYSYFLEEGSKDKKGAAALTARAMALGERPDFPESMCRDRDLLIKYLECAATILGVERIAVYNRESLAAAIVGKRQADEDRIGAALAPEHGSRSTIASTLREVVANRHFAESPYYYWRLVEECFPNQAGALLSKALESFSPELPAGLAWLEGLKA